MFGRVRISVQLTGPMEQASLGATFRRIAEKVLEENQDLQYEWIDGSTLSFPPQNEFGFEVSAMLQDDEVIVVALGAHEHFSPADGPIEEVAQAALGLIRDLLSPGMRVRERVAGRMPYRWCLEAQEGDEWHKESETGLLVFNYFGRRSERIYQNHQLPNRLGNAR